MKKILIITLLLILFSIENQAQLFPVLGGQRAGISTAQFLKIGVGGRASAMGDAFVAIANDASTLYWNPAGLVQFSNNEVIFSHNKWVADINHDFLGVVYHLDESNSFGLAFTSLRMDDMPVTTEFSPFGTGEYFSVSDFALGVSYARKMTDKFSFGGTVRYIESTLAKLKMRGLMIDLGTMYWTGIGSSRFAVSVTNFGNQLAPDGEVVLVGRRSVTEWQSYSPPTMFRFGFAIDPYETDRHKVTTSIQLNHPNDNSENVGLGAEYIFNEFSLNTSFFLRSGYKFNVEEQSFSLGAGVKLPISIAVCTIDYAYADFSRLGSSHRFSILLGF